MLKKYKGNIICYYIMFAIAMVVATLYDLKIDQAVYSPENPIALWFRNTGEMPSRLAILFGGLAIFITASKTLGKLIGMAIEIGGGIYTGCHLADYFFIDDGNKMIFGAIFGLGIALCFLAATKIIAIPKEYYTMIKTLAIAGIIAVIAVTLFTEVPKIFIGRIRFRHLVELNDFNQFMPWYTFHPFAESNEFKSMPSGHTSGAGLSYLLMLVPYIDKKFESKKNICFIIPVIYTAIVAFTRLVMGAHFLSDVACGGTISFTVIVIVIAILDKKNKKQLEK